MREEKRHGAGMSDQQLAELSEAIARSFMGWKPKPVGRRRFHRFEREVVQRILAGEHPVKGED